MWLILDAVAQGDYQLLHESTGLVGAAVVDQQWAGLADHCACLRQQGILILEVALSWCRRVGVSKRTSQWGRRRCRGRGPVHWKSGCIHRHFWVLTSACLMTIVSDGEPGTASPALMTLHMPKWNKGTDPREKWKGSKLEMTELGSWKKSRKKMTYFNMHLCTYREQRWF